MPESALSPKGEPKLKASYYSIGFYNVENLFDTVDDHQTLDDDFTEFSEKNWNEERFQKKVRKLGQVISSIGFDEIQHPPVILGVAEVENSKVIDALVASKFLENKGYGYVHFDSPDERGIDTALLYRKQYFSVINTKAHTVYLEGEHGERDFTRDILYVHGILEEQPLHILVNHWPSRRKGTTETSHKRMTAAQKNMDIMQNIFQEHPGARVVVMGDFNDDPTSESIKRLASEQMYNPMELLLTNSKGTLNHNDSWHLFDQIIISHNFLKGYDNPFRFQEAKIFDPKSIREYKGKYKGLPFRTYAGKKHLGGVSDHFPVYAIFSIH